MRRHPLITVGWIRLGLVRGIELRRGIEIDSLSSFRRHWVSVMVCNWRVVWSVEGDNRAVVDTLPVIRMIEAIEDTSFSVRTFGWASGAVWWRVQRYCPRNWIIVHFPKVGIRPWSFRNVPGKIILWDVGNKPISGGGERVVRIVVKLPSREIWICLSVLDVHHTNGIDGSDFHGTLTSLLARCFVAAYVGRVAFGRLAYLNDRMDSCTLHIS